ncbi:MAG: pimeloyl-CoA dehydrogenase small subunit [Gammaproteobacteria bacterium]|nr:MAG: pimeloyl-CoA dehydrogenase small subunit [Gammaproteobacteria bacterium]
MNFDFSEEQTMLRDSIARFIQDNYNFEKRRAIADSELGFNRENWQTFADLGWLSVPFAESYGGFGGDAVDTMVMMEELGKGLVLEPYFATVVLFGDLLSRGGSEAQKNAFIPKIIDGSLQGAFAYLERQSRFELFDVATTARESGVGFTLNGEKVVVYNGANADQLIVSARTGAEQFDSSGVSLFLVDANAAGVVRKDYRLMDGQKVANIVFENVSLGSDALLGELHGAADIIEASVLQANIALAAEAVGIMGLLNAKTLEYTKTREQFGVTIGSFQVLQHRMVDTFMAYEQARSLLYRAVTALTGGEEDATAVVHALKVLVEKSSKLIFAEAIQIHGGMGLTDELDIGHFAKRLMMINTTFGNGDYHQERFNALQYA